MNDAERMLKNIEEQNLAEAEKHFANVVRTGSDEEQYFLAQELFHYGFLEECKQLYEILLMKHPGEGELALLLAELLIEMDHEEEAFHYLESIDESDPSYPAALLIEADLYQMQGLFEVSEQKLQLAKQLASDEPVIDYALGELYMSQGRFLEAARYFKTLLESGESSFAGSDVNGRMAEALSAGGAFEQAIPYYEKTLDRHTEINVLFGYGLTLFQSEQYQKAIQAFTKLKQMDPDYHSLYLLLAKCYEHVEEVHQALETVQEGIALDGFNKELFFYGGKLALKTGNEALAEEYFRQALVLDPEYTEAAITLNKLFLHQEKYEDLLEIMAGFQLEQVEDPQLHWDTAISFQQLDQFSEALNEYEHAYNEFKNNRDFLRDYGYFLLEDGKSEKALPIFHQLLKMEPMNEEWVELVERMEGHER